MRKYSLRFSTAKKRRWARIAAKHLKDDGQGASCRATYRVMQENGLITPQSAKSKRRRRVRYERKHSNSMRHADWHDMKNSCLKGEKLAAFLDNALRCVTGAFLISKTVSCNSVLALRATISKLGTPAAILSDNGSCFTSRKRGVLQGSWQPALFEDELLKKGIVLISSRPYHPQTNGKLEQWLRTLENEMTHHKSLKITSTITRCDSADRSTLTIMKPHGRRSIGRCPRMQLEKAVQNGRRTKMTERHHFRAMQGVVVYDKLHKG